MQIQKNINVLHDKLNKWHFQLVLLRAIIMGEMIIEKQTESLQCSTYTVRVQSNYVKTNIFSVTPKTING